MSNLNAIETIGVCNADWCNPSHEPYPNIVSVMTGYNILLGNPFASGFTQDPGFSTGYIFVPTYLTAEGRYALHGGVTVRQVTFISRFFFFSHPFETKLLNK